jgi:hypothetical protein
MAGSLVVHRPALVIACLTTAFAADTSLIADEQAPRRPAVNWPAQLREWRKWTLEPPTDPAKSSAAGRENVEAIDDPAAIPAILSLLKTETSPSYRRTLVKPLLSMGGEQALAALVKLSVEDKNPLLREEVSKGLAGNEDLPEFLYKYIDYLHQPRWATNAVQALRWTKLLERQSVSDPIDPKLYDALVDALVQKQKRMVRQVRMVEVGTHSGWALHRPPWSGKIVKPTIVQVEVAVPEQSPEALEALKSYTSENYEYDQVAWRKALKLQTRK